MIFKFFLNFVLFSECADTVQFITAGSLKKCFGFVSPAVRFEPATAGYKVRTLLLFYAVPLGCLDDLFLMISAMM